MPDHFTKYDKHRLSQNRRALVGLMLGGQWLTPYEVAEAMGQRNAGTVMSHLRDLKASGLYALERRRCPEEGPGVHRYRLSIRKPEQLPLLDATA